MSGLGVFQVFYPDHVGNGGTSKPPFKEKVPHWRRGSPLPEKSLSGELVCAIYTVLIL